MPFMKGNAPIRRTLKYLEAGKLVFKDRVKVFSINYSMRGDHHKGARDFAFWYLPQIQFKNPDVQVVAFKNMTPSPFIRCFLDNGAEFLVDIDSRTKEEVHKHIKTILCKTDEQLSLESEVMEKKDNPANFGESCPRHCICEVPGQVPCPGVVPLPNHMRGKFIFAKD